MKEEEKLADYYYLNLNCDKNLPDCHYSVQLFDIKSDAKEVWDEKQEPEPERVKSFWDDINPFPKPAPKIKFPHRDFWLPIADPIYGPCTGDKNLIVFEDDRSNKNILCEVCIYKIERMKGNTSIAKHVIAR